MKTPTVVVAVLSAAFLLSSCEKPKSEPQLPAPESKLAVSAPASPAINADADKLLQSIVSAGPEEKSRAGKAAQAISAKNYSAALGILELLLKEGHLTPEQRELVTGIVGKLQDLTHPKP